MTPIAAIATTGERVMAALERLAQLRGVDEVCMTRILVAHEELATAA